MAKGDNEGGETIFILSVVGCARLTAGMLWPDGDAPDDPDVEDVEALIEECGGIGHVIPAWNLTDDFWLSVRALRATHARSDEDDE